MTGVAVTIDLVVVMFLFWKKRAPHLAAILALAAGAAVVGGFLGQARQQIITALSGATSQVTLQLLGTGVSAVLGVIFVLLFMHDMSQKSASRTTIIVAFFLPLVVGLIPGPIGSLIVSLVHLVETVVGGIISGVAGA
jgi:uncharacterized membrane protein